MQAELIWHTAPPRARRIGELGLQQRLDRGVVALDRRRDERVDRLSGVEVRVLAGARAEASAAQAEGSAGGQQAQGIPARIAA